ncbi:unnamed protein product [Phytomonas sp. EM1]|nr:unnamed protein product [Phytomonas sp. EM1]|eukprot:CCW65592.1 unnamed protein product [Phytomonas sp. isolate EM1]
MGCAVCRPGHDLPYAKPSRAPPDPSLFPNYLQNEKGLWLRSTEWWPRTEVQATVFIVSGLGEHANRYDSIARRLNEEGFACFSVDNQGAGGSEGLRLYVERFSHFVDNILLYVRHIHERYPELRETPQILLGHSMGGLISFLVALREPKLFKATVLSGPAFAAVDSPSPGSCKRKMLDFLSRTIPKLEIAKLNAELVSYNKPVVELVRQDPYYTNVKLRARFLAEFLEAQEFALAEVKRLKTPFPLLIVFGEDDKLCNLERAREIFRLFPSETKEMRTYPYAGHEVLTEVDREAILNDVVTFIKKHYRES